MGFRQIGGFNRFNSFINITSGKVHCSQPELRLNSDVHLVKRKNGKPRNGMRLCGTYFTR